MKYINYMRKHFGNSDFPVVRFFELRTALKAKGISDSYLKRIINYLIEKGELKRITKGIYTFHDDITVVGFAFQPFYFGLENALTIRKLWEQGTNPVIITRRKVRTGIRKFESSNYIVKRIKKDLFFGYELIKYYDFWIPVSDAEKTLLDFVYFKQYLREDVLKILRKQIDKSKLRKYLMKYPPEIKEKAMKMLKLKSL